MGTTSKRCLVKPTGRKPLLDNLSRERMSPEHARYDVDLSRFLAPHDVVWSEPLPLDHDKGAPIGNGDLGVLIRGMPSDLTFSFSKPDVWHRRDDEDDYFPESWRAIKQAFLDRDEAAYDRLLDEVLQRRPNTEKPPHLTTCGNLRLHLDEHLPPGGNNCFPFDSRIRLENATFAMRYVNRTVSAFVSHAYDVLVVEIDRGERTPFILELLDNVPAPTIPWELGRMFPECDGDTVFKKEGASVTMTQDLGLGGQYTIGLRWWGMDDTQSASVSRRHFGEFQPAGRRVGFFATVVSTLDTEDTEAECRRRLDRAERAGVETIRKAHRAHWEDLWNRSLIAVGHANAQKQYCHSIYMSGSGLRPGCQSPGLYGIWATINRLYWNADYHANIDIQSMYSGLFVNNRLDLVEPFLRLYQGFVPHAREVARDYFKMRGLRFPHAATIAGHDTNSSRYVGLALDPCVSAWLAQYFWHYYDYTRDEAFLRDIAYPILRDVALFYADYLTRDEATGTYVASPSIHFESDVPYFPGWGTNTLFSAALFRLGFTLAIRAAEILDVDPDARAEWSERLENMAPPPMTEDGLFKAFGNRDAFYEGHNFMLPMVYPGELVSHSHGPKEWLEAARKTCGHIRSNNISNGTNEDHVQSFCEHIRIGAVDNMLERFAANRGAQKPTDPYEGIEIGERTYSWCHTLGEMMVLSTAGLTHFFSAIPKDVPARFHSLRVPGGILLSGEKRGAEVDYILAEATGPASLRFKNPWDGEAAVTDLTNGRSVCASAADVIAFDLEAGAAYGITKAGVDIASFDVRGFALDEPEDADS